MSSLFAASVSTGSIHLLKTVPLAFSLKRSLETFIYLFIHLFIYLNFEENDKTFKFERHDCFDRNFYHLQLINVQSVGS